MNSSVYIFGNLRNGYVQYPDDYAQEVLGSFAIKSKSKTQVIVHRDKNLMYYGYVRRLDVTGQYIGFCVLLNGMMLSKMDSLFVMFEKAFAELVSQAEIIQMDGIGNIVSTTNQLTDKQQEVERILNYLRGETERLEHSASKLPPVNYGIAQDSIVMFSVSEVEKKIVDASFSYGYTCITKDDGYDTPLLAGLRSVLRGQSIGMPSSPNPPLSTMTVRNDRQVGTSSLGHFNKSSSSKTLLSVLLVIMIIIGSVTTVWLIVNKDKGTIDDVVEEIPQERIIYQSRVNVKNCFIVISKKSLSLRVYEGANTDTTLVAVFPVCLSKNKGQKYTAGDNKTPECSMDNPFRVTQIEDASTWRYDFGDGRGYILAYGHWFIRLNSEFSGIGIMGSTNNERSVPGRESSGSIRLKDDDLDFLKEHYVFEGMKVVIKREEEGLYDFEKRCIMLMENTDIPKKQNGSPNARDNSYSKGSGIDLRNRDLIFSVGGVSFCLKYVEGGTFIMGATDEQAEYAEKGEFPTHSVTLHDYYLGETEVTQELWEEVMGYNPANTIGASLPIENISWNDCADFIRELNNRTGKTFRLPTEAEWEYAARGGIYSRQCVYSGSDNAEEVGWVKSNCDGSTHPVGTRNSNELGIYDMTGNVCEWCQDWMSNYNSTDQVNPVGPNSGTARVGRGGGWCNSSLKNRVSTRFAGKTTYRDYNLGFRIAM